MGGVGGWRLTVKESETGACETDSSDEKRLRDRELDQWHGGEGEKWRRLRNSGRDWQRFSVHHVVCAFFLFLQRGRVWPNVTAPFYLESPEPQLPRPPQDHRARLGNNANTHTHTHIYHCLFRQSAWLKSFFITQRNVAVLTFPHSSLSSSITRCLKGRYHCEKNNNVPKMLPSKRDERQLFYFRSAAAPVRRTTGLK